MSSAKHCHCGSSKSFSNCCAPFIEGEALPLTAEQLMRSRFSAFVVHNFDYLWQTQDPQTCENFNLDENRKWGRANEFFRLEVLHASEQGNRAKVEFKAHFRSLENPSTDQVHHEVASFRRQAGTWYYRLGTHP